MADEDDTAIGHQAVTEGVTFKLNADILLNKYLNKNKKEVGNPTSFFIYRSDLLTKITGTTLQLEVLASP